MLRMKLDFLILIGTIISLSSLTSCLHIGKHRPYQRNTGLYKPDDKVLEFYENDFKCNIYGSNKAWVVEFYNTWCGFCQKFAPIYTSLAKNISAWDNIVGLAAIDCAIDDNYPICLEYKVEKTPTLRYFSANSAPGDIGTLMNKEYNETFLKSEIVRHLIRDQESGIAPEEWPNLTISRRYENFKELVPFWDGVSDDIHYQFILIEDNNSTWVAEMILDMQLTEGMLIRRVADISDEPLLNMMAIVERPKGSRLEELKLIQLQKPERMDARQNILDFLKTNNLPMEMKKIVVKIIDDKNKVKCGGEENEATTEDSTTESSTHQEEAIDEKVGLLQDLKNSIQYALKHEIPLNVNITGDELQALKHYLKVLTKRLPQAMDDGKLIVKGVLEKMENMSYISGQDFRELVELTENYTKADNFEPGEWVTCKGSESRYRGFPCGLWTKFHILTVSAANNSTKVESDDNEITVLKAMHGYIKYFFGCSDCSRHFDEMAKRENFSQVEDGDDGVLWLWRRHNEVNARIAGKESEDPKHKKIQYPSLDDCPLCRDSNGNWREDQVLEFLKNRYGDF